ncbi:unannotated protein [freshwater metagenome]|uniref:Unannotated protein n=1 Tax=freshwater metagenome TaxID=449393 RepID=A0A6J6KX41_9ZZZZ
MLFTSISSRLAVNTPAWVLISVGITEVGINASSPLPKPPLRVLIKQSHF